MNQVQELEQAILARAERLAGEYRERAGRSRDQILREAAERLRLREAREEAIAKSLGERTFRQLVQASELKMQTHLDRVRWNLVQGVERGLNERMRAFTQDRPAYLEWLLTLIAGAAATLESETVLVSVNADDRALLDAEWAAVEGRLPKGGKATLEEKGLDTLGGVLLRSADGRIRIDHTFEGRLERLRPRIQQVILERLLPSGFDTANLFSG